MMALIRLDKEGNYPVDAEALSRHLHLIGTTGAGKSVALQLIMQSLLFPSYELKRPCMFIVDPLGGLSKDFLAWVVSPFCPAYVRRRVLYIEPAHTDRVIPFNPLYHTDPMEIDFRVDRAQEVILRAWGNQNIEEMPSLARWLALTLYSLAKLKLPLGFAQYMVYPNNDEFRAIRDRQDEHVIRMWREMDDLNPSQLAQTLMSTRNRFQPFSTGVLSHTFSTYENCFDVERFIRERKIVIVNLAGKNRLKNQVKRAFGAFVVNQVIATVRGLANFDMVSPTYLVLDEFQNFVTQDMVSALPEVRQLGLRLALAHQSFSQLQQEDIDLSTLIPLAQNRFVFACHFEDADIIADEFAKRTFDPYAIKHVNEGLRQLHDGYRKVDLESWSEMKSQSASNSESRSMTSANGRSHQEGRSAHETDKVGERRNTYTLSDGISWQNAHGEVFGCVTGESNGMSHTKSQQYQSVYKTFMEETSRTYSSFQEQSLEFGKKIRKLKTGQAIVSLFNDHRLPKIQLRYDHYCEIPRVAEKIAEFKQQNFESDYFISPAVASQKFHQLREQIFTEKIVIESQPPTPLIESPNNTAVEQENHGFG